MSLVTAMGSHGNPSFLGVITSHILGAHFSSWISWFGGPRVVSKLVYFTYLRDVSNLLIGVILHLLRTMDIPVWVNIAGAWKGATWRMGSQLGYVIRITPFYKPLKSCWKGKHPT